MHRVLLIVGMFVFNVIHFPVQAALPEAGQTLQSVTLSVKNLTCAMCKYTVEKALQQVEGVQSAVVDMEKSTAVVSYDTSKTAVDELIQAVTNAGYPAALSQ